MYAQREQGMRGIRREDGDHLVTVRAGAYSRWEDDGIYGVERAVVYVTVAVEVKASSGSVC